MEQSKIDSAIGIINDLITENTDHIVNQKLNRAKEYLAKCQMMGEANVDNVLTEDFVKDIANMKADLVDIQVLYNKLIEKLDDSINKWEGGSKVLGLENIDDALFTFMSERYPMLIDLYYNLLDFYFSSCREAVNESLYSFDEMVRLSSGALTEISK